MTPFSLIAVEQRQITENDLIRELLKRNGDNLTAEREIDHWAYFPDRASRDSFINKALNLGFMLRARIKPEKNNPSYGAQVYTVGRPSFPEVDQQNLALFDLAAMLGGNYDGWDTWVVR
jgi:hypothetical protein